MEIKTSEGKPLFFDQNSSFQEKLLHRRHIIKSFKANVDAKRSITEKLTDSLTNNFGTISFFLINLTFFIIWESNRVGFKNWKIAIGCVVNFKINIIENNRTNTSAK